VDALVAHYHEIGLKGHNREFFEDTLTRNLKRALRGTGYRRVRRGFGRITVDFKPDNRIDEAAERAARVFGVANIGVGRRVEPDLDHIEAAALELMPPGSFSSFSVRARRSYSSLDLSSGELNVILGRLVQAASSARVDLVNPEATLHVELFGATGIIYRTKLEAPGGLPVGSSGRFIGLLSGGIDSPVAAWRMMRRGAELQLLHFHGQPYTDPSSVRQALDLTEVLTRYQLQTTLHLVPLGDVQREVVTHAPSALRVVLYRRMMMRIAAALAETHRATALVTGDSLGQVASQTIENLATVDAAVPGTQVLRPLIGADKLEIIESARRIGTFDVSTRKHQDCCVLFEPRAPATKTTADQAADAERDLDVDALVGKALAGIETRVEELPPP
jgi:thiamine biosynthesis protein ThiI